MNIQSKKEPIVLLLGDIFFLYISLVLMLILNYSGLPDRYFIIEHFRAFSFVFIIWIFVFFVAGLYEKHTVLFKNKLPSIILNAQLVNSSVAVLFFYLIPFFSITPKTNLFIYLIISFILMLSWRIYGYSNIGVGKKEKALIIGSGQELSDLINEVNNNSRYEFSFITSINLDTDSDVGALISKSLESGVSYVVADLDDQRIEPFLPKLYSMIYSDIRFIDKYKLYEEIFDKIPLSLIGYTWFLENMSLSPKYLFDLFKRVADIVISLVLGVFALIITPFVILAIKIDSRGKAFIVQKRIGQNNNQIDVIKFRTMEKDDAGEMVRKTKEKNKITRVGAVLRKTRIDELPQLWSILRGHLSLIGPRPELPSLAKIYTEEVPYYNVRHIVKPGLSGWAQLYQENPPKFETRHDDTKTKLSYDLYYIKNRSIMLDLKIALRTIKTLLSRSGV